MRRTIPILAVLVAAVAAAAPAVASTARVSGGTLVVTGGGETSNISFDASGRRIEDAAGIQAEDGTCTPESPTVLLCDPFTAVQASLGEGDDQYYDGAMTRAAVDGGGGNDTVQGGSQPDVLTGGPGNDTLDGDSENDEIDGGPGDDSLVGDDADDTITGGAGRDSINGDGPTAFGNGNDRISAADGEQDLVDCNFGTDAATVDAGDAVSNCESVSQAGGAAPPPPPPAAPPGGGGPATTGPPAAEPFRLSLSVDRTVRRRNLQSLGVTGSVTKNRDVTITYDLYLSARDARRLGLGRRRVRIGGFTDRQSPPRRTTFHLQPRRRFAARMLRRRGLRYTLLVTVRATDRATGEVRRDEGTATVR